MNSFVIEVYKGPSLGDPAYQLPICIWGNGKRVRLSNMRGNKLMARFLFWYFRKVVQSLSQS
jgi:hypothetical protein